MPRNFECCEKCTLRGLPHDGPILPFENDQVVEHIMALEGHREFPDYRNAEDRPAPAELIAAYACALSIFSGNCKWRQPWNS
jgi:hypothetical protein